MAGFNSGLPLQRAVFDFALQLPNPFALRIEHRDLVLDLDQREAGESLTAKLGENVLELREVGVEQRSAFVEMVCGLVRAEVVHEQEPGNELGIFAHRFAEELTQGARQDLSP